MSNAKRSINNRFLFNLDVLIATKFAKRITRRIAENTSTLTTQVEPNSRDISVTLLVSNSKKPVPMKKRAGSVPFRLNGLPDMPIITAEMTMIQDRTVI